MSKEKILKEFEQRFSSRSTIDLNLFPDVKQFLSQAIEQTKKETREETIREAKREVKKYVSSKKKILHFNRIIAGEEILAILNKLKK